MSSKTNKLNQKPIMEKTIKIYIILIAILLASCKKEDITPAFIEITLEDMLNSVDVSEFNSENQTNYTEEELKAIARQNFTHVALLANGTSLGVYTLPAKIPVLAYDSTRLYIMPCIKMNGISTTIRNYYGIVQPCTTTVFLKKGETYTFRDNPIRFKYHKGAEFPLLELFSNITTFKPDTFVSSIPIVLATVDGQDVGSVTVNGARKPFELVGPEMTLPSLGQDLFFEMDYKCDEEVFISIDIYYNTIWNVRSLIGIHAPDENSAHTWNKIYVNLTKVVGNGGQGSATVKARMRISGNSMAKEQAHFYFDNMKVIYIK